MAMPQPAMLCVSALIGSARSHPSSKACSEQSCLPGLGTVQLLEVSAACSNTWEQRKAGEGVLPLVPITVSAHGVVLCSLSFLNF